MADRTEGLSEAAHDVTRAPQLFIATPEAEILPPLPPQPLPKNKGGRPKGSVSASQAAKRVCRRLVDHQYLSRLRQRLLEGSLSPAVECMVLAYALGGKPVSFSKTETTGSVNITIQRPW